MDTQHRRVWIGIRRETVKIKPVRSVLDSAIERFELVALERPCLVSVFELNDDASVLYVSNTKSPMGEWRNERRTLGEVVNLLEKRVPLAVKDIYSGCEPFRLNLVHDAATGRQSL